MIDRTITSKTFVWGENYMILDVVKTYGSVIYLVKSCVDKEWVEKRFYKPNRVISYYRSLRKAGSIPFVAPLQHHGKVLDELQALLQPA